MKDVLGCKSSKGKRQIILEARSQPGEAPLHRKELVTKPPSPKTDAEKQLMIEAGTFL